MHKLTTQNQNFRVKQISLSGHATSRHPSGSNTTKHRGRAGDRRTFFLRWGARAAGSNRRHHRPHCRGGPRTGRRRLGVGEVGPQGAATQRPRATGRGPAGGGAGNLQMQSASGGGWNGDGGTGGGWNARWGLEQCGPVGIRFGFGCLYNQGLESRPTCHSKNGCPSGNGSGV